MKIPTGVTVQVDGNKINVAGPKAKLSKSFNPKIMKIEVSGDEVTIKPIVKNRRKVSAAVNTIEAHLRNMVKGSIEEYSKKLQVVYAHFPVTIEVKGNKVSIKNFLGEKLPRTAKIIGETQVKVAGQEITVSGHDKESVGQTSSNLVRATRIRKKDIRIFQDGIYYS